jgi:hypothetical protein
MPLDALAHDPRWGRWPMVAGWQDAPHGAVNRAADMTGADQRFVVMTERHLQVDFDCINRCALAALPALLERWLPGGRREGWEYVALNLTGKCTTAPNSAEYRIACLVREPYRHQPTNLGGGLQKGSSAQR